MEYEARGLYVLGNTDGIGEMRVLQKRRLDVYRSMIEGSRSRPGSELTGMDGATKCNEGEECGEDA